MKQKYVCPNNSLFILALIFLIIFLLLELILRIYNLYFHEPLVDVPSHFFAGIAISAGATWIVSLVNIRRKKLFSVLVTLAVAIVWEVLEILEEMVVENPPHLQDVFFWDGFFDIMVTVFGGIFFIIILFVIRKTTNLLDDIG